jgi:flagellar hook-associated protein FlgK
MSIYGNIHLLSSALRTFQYGLNATSNNIANAATPGYSRQVLNLEALPFIYDGSMPLGSGVTATSLQRIRDTFLDSRIQFEYSELGRAKAEQQALTELAAIFPEVALSTSTAGLKGAIDNVVAKWTALAAAPGDLTVKSEVRDALRALADMLQSGARKTFDLQQRIDRDIRLTITEINGYLDQIAFINKQLKSTAGKGTPGALLDIRQQAAQKLAELIDADFRVTADGSMHVTTGVGTLINGDKAFHLIGINSPTDPGRTAIGYSAQQGAAARNVTESIQGGKLGGLLSVRDGEVEKARLDLDRIAFGIISRSNEINRTYTAGDGTSQHNLFVGNRAADIVLNPIVAANPDYIGGTRDGLAPGDLARMQAELKGFVHFSSMRTAPGFDPGGGTPIDPDAALSTQIFAHALGFTTPGSPGQFVIATTGNAVTVTWDETQSLNEVIRNINATGAGAFYATYDQNRRELIIVGQTPMTVYDTASNLLEVFGISSVVTSSAPINNYPVPGSNLVDPFGPMNNTQNLLNLFSSPLESGGTVLVDGNPVNWAVTDDIGTTINLAITAATAPPYRVGLNFNAADQTVSVFRSGDPTSANLGVHNFSLGNTMQAVQIVDQAGNLTRTLNLDTNTNATGILDELIVTVSGRKTAEGVMVQQAQALVDQTQALQDQQSKVDLNAELAQARLYQRSYEASVRMQFILDEILNTLINRTGSSASGSSAV